MCPATCAADEGRPDRRRLWSLESDETPPPRSGSTGSRTFERTATRGSFEPRRRGKSVRLMAPRPRRHSSLAGAAPHHADLDRPEERLHALRAIRSEAVSQIERTRSGVVAEDPEKGIALADGDIEEALTDTSSPVRLRTLMAFNWKRRSTPAPRRRPAAAKPITWPWTAIVTARPPATLSRHISRNRLMSGAGRDARARASRSTPPASTRGDSPQRRDIVQRRWSIGHPVDAHGSKTILPKTSPLIMAANPSRASASGSVRSITGRTPVAAASGQRDQFVTGAHGGPDHPERLEEDLGQLGLGRIVARGGAADHQGSTGFQGVDRMRPGRRTDGLHHGVNPLGKTGAGGERLMGTKINSACGTAIAPRRHPDAESRLARQHDQRGCDAARPLLAQARCSPAEDPMTVKSIR